MAASNMCLPDVVCMNKSIWNGAIRQVQQVARIQHNITTSAEEQTTLQALHVHVHELKDCSSC